MIGSFDVHSYTQSVHQCAQFSKGVFLVHFVHTFWGYTHFAHFYLDITNLCTCFLTSALFALFASIFMHTFFGRQLTSPTLIWNLCTLYLNLSHTIRLYFNWTLGCLVLTGFSTHTPCTVKQFVCVLFFWHQPAIRALASARMLAAEQCSPSAPEATRSRAPGVVVTKLHDDSSSR
jgi:hypothetical protein